MSASSKKKLRKEQTTAAMTEKQMNEVKEAKKLKLYSAIFIAVIAIVLCIAIAVGVSKAVNSTGIIQRSTVAATIGSHKVSSAEMNYFFVDSVNSAYSNWNQQYQNYTEMYLQIMGLNIGQPLNEQPYMGDETMTWADYFAQNAADNARSNYALYDAAIAAGRQLTAEEVATIDQTIETMAYYATAYGLDSIGAYLKAAYGPGANEKGYRQYREVCTLASVYYNEYMAGLSYDDAALRSFEAGHENEYNSYSYASYYLSANKFRTGGTADADGNVTYSDEEVAASVQAAKAAADSLAKATTVEELDTAIAALEINAGTSASSSKYTNTFYSNVSPTLSSWITDPARKAGDVGVVANEDSSEDETTVLGYYVVMFQGSTDNAVNLVDVRHILVSFQGGTADELGNVVYSDAEKQAALDKITDVESQWQTLGATEESFISLAASESTDGGSASNGGLYEGVYPGQMVTAFNDWCFDASRKPGDSAIIETEYGYHLMYFVAKQDTTYRDRLITNAKITEDMGNWYNGLLDATVMSELNTAKMNLNMVIRNAS